MRLQDTQVEVSRSVTGRATSPAVRLCSSREDWAFVHELCARTGKAGDPIDRERWPFFGEQWVGPYEKLRPEWSYLACDPTTDQRLGYLTGCPDTRRYLRERQWLFDLPLFLKIQAGVFLDNSDTKLFAERFLKRQHGPEEWFEAKQGAQKTREVQEEFPAHLHINLEGFTRGRGVGRFLVDRYREDLRKIGVRGIHLYCGDKPLPFYLKTGFTEIDRIEFKPGVFVYRLGSRF